MGAVTILALAGLFSFLLTGALGVFIAFMVLMIRQVLIIMLILIAPVAIVLYIMPNTNNYFRMWWDTLSKALLMFPLIVGMITAGRVFAAVSAAQGGNAFNQIIGYAAYFAPYFMIPMTFRFAGGMISAIGNGLQQAAQPAYGGLSKYRARKAGENWKRVRSGQRWNEDWGRFKNPITGKQTGLAHMANRLSTNVFDQDELLPWRLGKSRPNLKNPLTGKPWNGVPGLRRGAEDLQNQLDDRAITESQQMVQELDKKTGGAGLHYEAWRGISGQHQDYKGHDANGVLIRDRLAQAGFVDSKTGEIKRPSSIGDFRTMGQILQESDSDKERLGGGDLLAHAGTLSSVKKRPDNEYADTQIMAAIAQSAAGRAEPEALATIGDSVESRLGFGVADRTMKAAQHATSRTERPDLRDGHGIIRTADGHWESSYSAKNFASKTAVDSVMSVKGSAWSGAKAEAVQAAQKTLVHIAKGNTGDAGDQQAIIDSIRMGISNPYNDAGQRKAWRQVAEDAGLHDLVDTPARSPDAGDPVMGAEPPAPPTLEPPAG